MDKNSLSSGPPEDAQQLLSQTGMTAEEKAEILDRIDEVVDQNKIPVTDELFKLKPRKRGGVFPIMLNLIMIILLAGGVYYAFRYFNVRQENLSLETEEYFSTEGKLIEELKRESETKLKKKDEEIEKIQTELAELDRQSQALQDTMEDRIKSREDELRVALEEELEAERQRLQAIGTSQEDIEARLRQLEEEQQAEFNAEIWRFREEAQAEIQEKEQELQQARSLTQEILDKASREKQALQEDTQRREEELRSSFEAERAALQSQTTEAEERLKNLADLRDRELLVSDQIIGLYDAVMEKIDLGDIPGAESDLQKLETLLMDQQVTNLPSIAKRRDIELFTIKTIRESLESSVPEESQETASLIDAANMVLAAREIVSRGEAAQNEGDIGDAERLFLRAIREIPSINRAYTGLEQIETANDGEVLASYIQEGEKQFSEGEVDGAKAQYMTALAFAGKDNAPLVDEALRGVERTIRLQEQQDLLVKDSAIEGLEEELRARESRIRGLNRDLEELEESSRSAVEDLKALQDDLALREARIEELTKTLVALQNNMDDSQAVLREGLQKKIQDAEAEIERLREQLKEGRAEVVLNYEELAQEYRLTAERVETLLDSDNPENYERAWNILMDVFKTETGRNLYPEVSDLLEETEIAITAAARDEAAGFGRDSALRDILRFVDHVSRLTPAGRAAALTKVVFDSSQEEDVLFQATVEGIRDLSMAGSEEVAVEVERIQDKLLGTVASVTAGRVVVERLVQMDIEEGDTVIIKRKSTDAGESSIAKGVVLNIQDGKITARINKLYSIDRPPIIMDLVYATVTQN